MSTRNCANDYSHDLSKRWYVFVYAWDTAQNSLVRKRLFNPINRAKTVTERLIIAEHMIAIINDDLRSGKVLGKDQVKDNPIKAYGLKMSFTEAIDYVGKDKEGTIERSRL